jgi:hypothetical protein
MANPIFKKYRTSTLFEKLLLFIGITLVVIGFWLLNNVFQGQPGLTPQFVTLIFLWLLLIFVVILTASNESIKEELSVIIKEHIEETKLIKQEIKILNDNIKKKKKK